MDWWLVKEAINHLNINIKAFYWNDSVMSAILDYTLVQISLPTSNAKYNDNDLKAIWLFFR